MRFTVVTPSYRSSRLLKLCIASVADQGVEVEHIVQDACSDDETQGWLPRDPRVKAFVEPDAGMYDAINRGLRRASGDILAYLNCDEQYLPGALPLVQRYFADHAEVDVAFGDAVVVAADGSYLCHRRSLLPGKRHTQVSGALCVFTAATFFRRRLLDRGGAYFDPRLRALGDAHWVLERLERGATMGLLRAFTSTFTAAGERLSHSLEAQSEREALRRSAPAWARALRPAIIAHHRLRKWWSGGYRQEPFDYALFTVASPDRRVTVHVGKPSAIWRERGGDSNVRAGLPMI